MSVATAGAILAIHGVTVAVLELPTGGLADTIGRRPVLLLSAALHVVAIVVWGTATRVQMFAVASVVLGAGRALSSGPLEAWFVDAILSSDAEADLKPGLARGGTAEGIALCLGTVVGGPARIGVRLGILRRMVNQRGISAAAAFAILSARPGKSSIQGAPLGK